MKKNIIAIGIALALAGGYFLVKKLMKKGQQEQPARSHHLTDVFSRAKDLAVHN